MNKTERIDTDPQGSRHRGIVGLYEAAFRKFKTFFYVLTVTPIYLIGCAILGASVVPGIELFRWAYDHLQSYPWLIRDLGLGMSLATGFVLYGFSIIFLAPLANFVLHTKPKIFRGPYYSVDFLRWFVHNSLTYIVRYTFLEFITPTPFNLLFFRLMGMKIGKGTQINSSNISDPGLIEMGDYVTIGGSATICAHYGQDGYLILSPVKIGNRVTIGLKASVMGGVEIGDRAKILPHSVVMPKTVIPPGEIWGGVPATKITLREIDSLTRVKSKA